MCGNLGANFKKGEGDMVLNTVKFLRLVLMVFMTLPVTAQSQVLKEVELMPPFLGSACISSEYGQMGALGIVVESAKLTENKSEVLLEVTSHLLVCRISSDGTQKFNWEKVNPFLGFDVQYYDSNSNSLKLRRVWIDPTKSYNGLKMSAVLNPDGQELKFATIQLTESASDSFTGTLKIQKSDLLKAKDIEKIEAGEVVRKKIELYHVSNFTTYLDGEEIRLGDETRSGRNVFLTFKK